MYMKLTPKSFELQEIVCFLGYRSRKFNVSSPRDWQLSTRRQGKDLQKALNMNDRFMMLHVTDTFCRFTDGESVRRIRQQLRPMIRHSKNYLITRVILSVV